MYYGKTRTGVLVKAGVLISHIILIGSSIVLRSQTATSWGFHKHTTLAITQILATEKNPVTKCYSGEY